MRTLVMIPTYNERDNLPRLVREILKMRDTGVVIVDDSSPDGTGEIADRLSREYKTRIFVIHRKNRGRGTAGIEGLKKCLSLGAKYVIEMDADFSHDPKYIPIFLSEMRNCDVVIGSRFVGGGRDIKRRLLRKYVTNLSRLIHFVGLRVDVMDMGSGFKCYRSGTLRAINLDKFVSKGFGISMELNYKIARKGFRIKEYPIRFIDRKRGKSKLSLGDFFESLLVILKLNLMKV